ncbi:MAG: hypothetical protein RL235_929, partial [Chlamydiota bacterium]
AYIGFDTVATLAQEAKNPQRSVPIGILGSLAVCTVAYVVTSLVLTGVADYRALGVPDPMSVALEYMGSKFLWFRFIVKAAILAGLASVVMVQLLGHTRVLYAISRDGLLPKKFSHVHGRSRTPLFSSVMSVSVAVIIAGLFPINVLGELVSMATLFLFSIVCLGVWILRHTHPEYERPFKVPFVPVVPLIGIVVCLGQMCFLPLVNWVQLLLWYVVGTLVYFGYSKYHSHLGIKTSK